MEKEVTVKDVMASIGNGFRYLLSKWLLIVVIGILGGIAGLAYAFLATPTYTASLNFILSSGSKGGNILNLATQLGMDVGGGGSDVFSEDNIISLMKSRRMVQQALLKKPDGSKFSLLNMYCVDNDLNKSWANVDRLKSVYPFPDSLSMMTPVQDSIFREIYGSVQENNLEVVKPREDQSIFNVITTSPDEKFSYYLTLYIVDVTSSFYIAAKTKVASGNLAMLQHEADSLRSLLGSAITSTASQADAVFNLNQAYQVQRSSSQKSQVQVTVVGTAYGEVVKNIELAKIALQKDTPLYQTIDEPSLPLKLDKPGKLTSLILGGFLGGFVIIAFLLIKRFFRQYSYSSTNVEA